MLKLQSISRLPPTFPVGVMGYARWLWGFFSLMAGVLLAKVVAKWWKYPGSVR